MVGSWRVDPVSAPTIGIDSFSYHRWFGECSPWEEPVTTRWSTGQFLDRAAALGAEAVSLQTVYLEPPSHASIRRLVAAVESLGLDLVIAWGHRSGLEGGTNPGRLREALRWVDACSDIGVDLVRIVCGDQTWWGSPVVERIRRLSPMIEEICARAGHHGMSIAIENHADFTMASLVELVHEVDAPNLGICFDTGNARRVGDDVVASASQAAPTTLMVHVKDLLVQPEAEGDPAGWWPSVPLGRGDLPLVPALELAGTSPHDARWFVEMANMHPNHPDEDTAVAESLAWLRALVEAA